LVSLFAIPSVHVEMLGLAIALRTCHKTSVAI
jgi:hypothetical protein